MESSQDVITAQDFDRAAVVSGRTMLELADLIGVSRSMVHGYRKHGVTRPRTVEHVRRVMGLWLRDERGNVLDGYSDDELLAELGRRLRAQREEIDASHTFGAAFGGALTDAGFKRR